MEAAQITNLSLRRLQWLDEYLVVSPFRDKHRRVYTLTQLSELLIIEALRAKGVSMQKCRDLVPRFRRFLSEEKLDTVSIIRHSYYLVTDNVSVAVAKDMGTLVDLITLTRSAVWVVWLGSLLDQLERR